MKKVLLIFFLSYIIYSFTEKEQKYQKINQDSKLIESIKRGKEIYIDMCVTCHLPNGQGIPRVFPPLANSDYLLSKRAESIRAIKNGVKGKIVVNGVTYRQIMPPLGLENDEVADVMNYITNAWGNKNLKMITVNEVEMESKN
ncbi:cytochrome c [Polaribacter litorisediminis]|uniref:c-type cytochrome n=1 Tax=Polaribacter litorisediminis TaxID=1908341 RepID=UPI001CBADE06|nr:cytochrome c [Polaribacter litorisediminis]UAM96713.1 cytochrome c [Polaribacter litorisediminis]